MRHRIWNVHDAIVIMYVAFSIVGGDQEAYRCFNVLHAEGSTIQEESIIIDRRLVVGMPEVVKDSLFGEFD
jgi:hypothetical protein